MLRHLIRSMPVLVCCKGRVCEFTCSQFRGSVVPAQAFLWAFASLPLLLNLLV